MKLRAPLELALRLRHAPLEFYGEIALAFTLFDPGDNDLRIDLQGGLGFRVFFWPRLLGDHVAAALDGGRWFGEIRGTMGPPSERLRARLAWAELVADSARLPRAHALQMLPGGLRRGRPLRSHV